MILVALGSNLVNTEFATSQQLLEAALNTMKRHGINVVQRSSWYRSAPVPPSGQPWFVNGVAQVRTALDPDPLLDELHAIEDEYGRIRVRRNDSRTLDLDLLAYHDRIVDKRGGLLLPHPRLQERAFVLLPLVELAPDWRHPITGLSAAEMLAVLPEGQAVERVPDA